MEIGQNETEIENHAINVYQKIFECPGALTFSVPRGTGNNLQKSRK
jgi:hypothetical protein